jgi:hypothetical protein
LDSIYHRLNHERDMAADVDIDVAANMDVDTAVDMDVDVADDVVVDRPSFHGPGSSGPNIFGLLSI